MIIESLVFCENLQFSAVSRALQMLGFPGEGVNLRNLRFALSLSLSLSLCHLSSVPLSASMDPCEISEANFRQFASFRRFPPDSGIIVRGVSPKGGTPPENCF